MLTKSLHTITAATNVARFLQSRKVRYTDAHDLAVAALAVLGYEADNFATDDTQVRILKNCEKIIAEGNAVRS